MHVPYEGPGWIEDWLHSRTIHLEFWRMYEKIAFPSMDSVDLLVVMGGPMNVYDHDRYPFLEHERDFIKHCILKRKKVLGICLGAQMIANALEEKVYPCAEREIGWFPVAGDRRILPGSFIPFHWHGDTFDLPKGSMHLASSLACKNQAFRLGNHVLALQFHLEVNEGIIGGLLESAGEDLKEEKWIQTKDEIRHGLTYQDRNREILFSILSDFTGWMEK
jgi:GMP synthase-like glutamine amidotransferase